MIVGYRYSPWGIAWRITTGLIKLVWRFSVGAELDGKRRTNATFLQPGTTALGKVPAYLGATYWRWPYLPGWQRAAIRWGCVAFLPCYATDKWLTLFVTTAIAAVYVWRSWPRWMAARHVRTVVKPLWVGVCGHLGVSPTANPLDWLLVPQDYATNRDGKVVLGLPAHFQANPREQKAVNDLIKNRLGGDWDAHWRTKEFRVFWTRPPAPPKTVPYENSTNQYKPMVGKSIRANRIVFNLGTEAPHVFVAAETGRGKSSTLRVFIAHARWHGWLVDIIDPKRRSFMELDGVPGVRIHTDIQSQIEAFEEFYLSMDGINDSVMARRMAEQDIPHRLMVVDEMTSFVDMARNYYKRNGGKGDLPFQLQFQFATLQGRQAQHRLVVAPHQADAKVFTGTAIRNSFAGRLAIGSPNRSMMQTAFGLYKAPKYDSRHPGRGLVGIGEGEPEEIQIAWISEEDCRALCLEAAQRHPVPDWFTRGLLPPWVTVDVLEQAKTVAGVGWLSPWEPRLYRPAETSPDVPRIKPVPSPENQVDLGNRRSPSAIAEIPAQRKPPHLRLVKPDDQPPQEELIVGVEAAARFLGYDKPDSFERARRRYRKVNGHGIPGETRTKDGRPAWSASALRSWQSKRMIAGAREVPVAERPTGTEHT